MQVEETLQWLLSGGTVLVVKWFASWYLEDLAWWNEKLSSKNREILILMLSLILGVGATVLVYLPPETFAQIRPFMAIVLFTVSTWLTGQVAHRSDKEYKNGNAQKKS